MPPAQSKATATAASCTGSDPYGGVSRAAGPLGVDAVLVVLALVSAGTAVLAYLIGWVLIPQEKAGSAASGSAQTEAARAVAQPTARVDIGAWTATRRMRVPTMNLTRSGI